MAVAIQQCYQHVFYPSRNRLPRAEVDLAHTALALHNTSDSPGAPAYIRDRTPLRKGQMTTLALRDEFRRDPALPILLGDEVFVRAVRKGVEDSVYVYRSGALLYGPGDPNADIRIDENSVVFTMEYARQHDIWPRPKRRQAARPAAKMRAAELAAAVERARALTRRLSAMAGLASVGRPEIQGHHLRPSRPKQSSARR